MAPQVANLSHHIPGLFIVVAAAGNNSQVLRTPLGKIEGKATAYPLQAAHEQICGIGSKMNRSWCRTDLYI